MGNPRFCLAVQGELGIDLARVHVVAALWARAVAHTPRASRGEDGPRGTGSREEAQLRRRGGFSAVQLLPWVEVKAGC